MARNKIGASLTVALLVLAFLSSPASALLKKGEQLPEFIATTISGEQFASDRLQGQPLILKLGTTWCGTCKAQAKTISGMRDYLKAKQVRYVDIFIQEDAETVLKYFKNNGYQLPDQLLLDDGRIARQLNIYLIPRVLLIDKNQQVYRDGPNLSAVELKRQLEQMLAD